MKTGPTYTQEVYSGFKQGIALKNGRTFFVIDIERKRENYDYTPSLTEQITLHEWVFKTFGDCYPQESSYVPGTYYSRIWRPHGPLVTVSDYAPFNQALVALRILLSKVQELFETVEPVENNKDVYGHKIRELLLLACMEAESSWSAVLKANNYLGKRWTTKDYVKLKKAMLLDAFKVGITGYDDFIQLLPFKDWDPHNPTVSMPWYEAYNATKHDREGSINHATLEHAITAVGAVVVLFFAQFGWHFPRGEKSPGVVAVENVFWCSFASLIYPKESYVPAFILPFGSETWKCIDYPF